jgi:hypothetical protein
VNASFEITIASVGGIQQITQRNLTSYGDYFKFSLQEQVTTIEDPQNRTVANKTLGIDWSPYLSHYYALGGLLLGNVSLSGTIYSEDGALPIYSSEDTYLTRATTTNLLSSGLIACDEIQSSPFRDLSMA